MRKVKNESWSLGPENGLPKIFVERKIDNLDVNFNSTVCMVSWDPSCLFREGLTTSDECHNAVLGRLPFFGFVTSWDPICLFREGLVTMLA